jgi:predicted kinase/diadenosine tetraphosphatase ApaH/serine/threonine PP2A family protein phosphatase/8-oxo-dGTP pyrophosphatase MutT (NUDIX family)
MTISLPSLCLVALVGPSGAGKSTFGRRHFKPTEVVSSDYCRGLVSDDENSLDASADAFDVLYHVVGKRLARGLLTVVDATNVREEDRAQLVKVAREHDVFAVAVVLDTPEPLCHERNRGRPGRDFGPHVVRRQLQQLRRSLRGLTREGFRHVFVLDTPEAVEQAVVERVPLWTDKRHESGPFDVVGDVHGCYDELVALLTALGYRVDRRPADPTTPKEFPAAKRMSLGTQESTPHALGRAPDASGGVPDASGGVPEASGGVPEAFGRVPETFGGVPEAFGGVPEAFGGVPEALGGFPKASGTSPDAAADPAGPAGGAVDPGPAKPRGPIIPAAGVAVGPAAEIVVTPPPGRRAIFVGDLVDRGPDSPSVLRLVMSMVRAGTAFCVPGNHDVKLLRKLRGKDVKLTHGLAETMAQLATEPPAFLHDVERFIDSLVSHYVLDGGRLVVAHAGMKQAYVGRSSGRVREFALYGDTTGETDELGLPERLNWAADYRGPAAVVYGHTPVPRPDWLNNTLNIDTGCVFGGALTALRWPERETVSVPARREYAAAGRPFLVPPVDGAVPVFGVRAEGVAYAERPGVYAVARDAAGRVAVVRVPVGAFLPGGGANPGESHEQTLAREVREETGHAVRLGRPIGRATQLVVGRDGKGYEKQGTYYEAEFGDRLGDPTEADHALEWLAPDAAIDALSHDAQKWAVRQVVNFGRTAQQQHDDVLDLADVVGKRVVTTRLHQNVTVREENAIAALEVMSRFAADPRWLVYLPPTMSPVETSTDAGTAAGAGAAGEPGTAARPPLLEHPAEAFAYFRNAGVGRVVCQEKHMGSRAVVVVGKDAAAVARRFGVDAAEAAAGGVVLTRTGRRFFDDRGVEADLLARLRAAVSAAGLWDRFASDWLVLDCELMPWSAKAQDLLRDQYAAVGSAARGALASAVGSLQQAVARHQSDPALSPGSGSLAALLDRYETRRDQADRYVAAYGRYCWPVRSAADLRLAPFHLLAAEGEVFVGRDHAWHMRTLAEVAAASAALETGPSTAPAPVSRPADGPATPTDRSAFHTRGGGVVMATAHREVDLSDPTSVATATDWWFALTAGGGEGMVVKPLDFVTRGPKGLVQPALKVRGPEYLRIIYGPEYDAPANLSRLRRRAVGAKRSLALREFALGVEALERFVRREPLRRVHECAFGVLALESEPVDPRL